jgi:hypothetical protein
MKRTTLNFLIVWSVIVFIFSFAYLLCSFINWKWVNVSNNFDWVAVRFLFLVSIVATAMLNRFTTEE